MCFDKCVEISIPFECKMGCFLLVDLDGDFGSSIFLSL